MLGAVGNENLVHAVFQAVILFKPRGDGAAQFQRSAHGGIAGHAHVHGVLHGLTDRRWRFKIRFAGGKADHVNAGLLELFGPCVHGKGGRRGDGGALCGDS